MDRERFTLSITWKSRRGDGTVSLKSKKLHGLTHNEISKGMKRLISMENVMKFAVERDNSTVLLEDTLMDIKGAF